MILLVVRCPKCGNEVEFKGRERIQGDGLYSGYISNMEIEDDDIYGCEDTLNCHYRISGKEYKRRQIEEDQ